LQRLSVVGFVEYMPRDFNRLQVGLLATILYTLAHRYVRPYKRSDVGVLAVGVQVALIGVFFGALNIRLYGDLSRLESTGSGGGAGGACDASAELARDVLGFYSSTHMAVWIFACNMVKLRWDPTLTPWDPI